MNDILKTFIFFGVYFVIVFLVYIIFINRKRKRYIANGKQLSIEYLVKKFNLDISKHNYKKLKFLIALLNSFIIAFTCVLIMNVEKYFLKMIIGFVVLIILIYSVYEILGRKLKSIEKNQN